MTDANSILFLEPENKKRKCPTYVEEEKIQGSETLHFPSVTEIFRTIRIQSILKFCRSIILTKGAKGFFFSFGRLYQRISFSPELIQGRSKTIFFVKTRLCVSPVVLHFTSFFICVFNECLAAI
jgi:hypothetical protein